jgi:S1-C subfamily serine protease
MNAPTWIANAARARVRADANEIKRSLRAIADGRPGDAEPDETRRAAVLAARCRMPIEAARREAPKTGPEAIWGKTIDFVGVNFFERGRRAGQPVCRVTRGGQGFATGFRISPHLIITNNHVIGAPAAAAEMAVEFDYELDIAGLPREVTRFALAPDLFVPNQR